MADVEFNISKGKTIAYHDRVVANDPANSAIIVVLLQVSEADATLIDYDTLNDVLGAAGNTEANFTNYARKVLTNTELSASVVDDTNNWVQIDCPNQTWGSAGGTVDNTMTKVLFCYDNDTTGGNDTNLVPMCCMDFTPTTNGNDLVLQINANGYFRQP